MPELSAAQVKRMSDLEFERLIQKVRAERNQATRGSAMQQLLDQRERDLYTIRFGEEPYVDAQTISNRHGVQRMLEDAEFKQSATPKRIASINGTDVEID